LDALAALLGQLLRIVLGYLAACAAAALFATVAVLMNAPALGSTTGADVLLQFLLLGWLGTTLIALAAAFVPAVLVAVVAEALKLRSPILYVAAGAVIALAPPLLEQAAPADGQSVLFAFDFAALFLACGLVGGFVYWMVAGRHAGRWQAEFVLDMD
jgi:hypothetical protein